MNVENESNRTESKQEKFLKDDVHTDNHSPATGPDAHPVAGGRSQNVESIEDMEEHQKASEGDDKAV